MKNFFEKNFYKISIAFVAVFFGLAYQLFFSDFLRNSISTSTSTRVEEKTNIETAQVAPQSIESNLEEAETVEKVAIEEKEPSSEKPIALEAEKKEEAKAFPVPDLKIGIISDAHSGKEFGYSRISGFTGIMKREGVDAIVNVGDLTESRFEYKKLSEKAAMEEYKKTKNMMANSHDVIGNHEVLSMSKDDLEKITGRNNYYAFEVKGYQIIILDANYTDGGENIDADGKDMKVYKGMIPKEQSEWLKRKLEKSNKNIIFCHNPLYNLFNEKEIEDIIKEHKKDILFIANGHKHPDSLRHSKFGGVDNFDIPSAKFQKSYSFVKIFDKEEFVSSKKY